MATTNDKTCCIICRKEKARFKCSGCLKEFCYIHLGEHQEELNKQLDEMEVNRDLFRQSLTEKIQEPSNDILIQQINKWEHDSIKKVQQTIKEAREILLQNTTEYIHQVEMKLNEVINQLRQCRQENDVNEINLRQFQQQLKQLTRELIKPSSISIREDSTSFIGKVFVNVSESTFQANIHHNARWIQNGFTVAEGNALGNGFNQLFFACGVYVDDDQTIYVADFLNYRIVEWKSGATNSQVVAGSNEKGN